MDVVAALSLLVAAAFIVAAFLHRHIIDPAAYRKALSMFVAALILYYPVSALITVGPFLSFVARPLGFILIVVSLRVFCVALIPHRAPAVKEASAQEIV